MWKTNKPLKELSERSKKKLKKTAGLAVKAVIAAMSENTNDHSEIWNYLKESGCVEKELGTDDSLDANLREIRKAHNMASSEPERIQILSLVAKVPFWKLKKFNPPELPKNEGWENIDQNEDTEMMSEEETENDNDYEDIPQDQMDDTMIGE